MKSHLKVSLAISALAMAALACQALTRLPGLDSGDADTPISTSAPPNPDLSVPAATEASLPTGDVILSDEFAPSRNSNWGTGTDADSSVEYDGDALRMKLFTKNYFVWSTPDMEDYQDVHIEVTVFSGDTDPTTSFGILCNQQVTDSAFYYLAMTPGGEYAIAKAAVAQTDVFLTNNDQWGASALISKNASSYRVGADCGHGTLTLYVDGRQIDSVSDSSYTAGGIGLLLWSGENVAAANVSFDDFVATKLK